MALDQAPPASRRLAAACLLEAMVEAGFSCTPPPPPKAVDPNAQPHPIPCFARIQACRACSLGHSRHCAVAGEGSVQAQIMFVGEAPGAEEDRQGRPFVGPAGQLLQKILQGGMGLAREDVFLANILKCRPPHNRDPLPAEIKACTPFLEEQIQAVQPQLLVALGRHAAQHLLQTKASLGSLRGKLHPRPSSGPLVLVTYHPAYLLRNLGAKKACWEDIQLGMRHLGLPLPGS